jgi:DNA processing protein
MDDRGLLDLVIALLPGLNYPQRILLQGVFDREEDFVIQSKENIEKHLKCELRCFWNIDEIRVKAEWIMSVCAKRSIQWVSWTDAAYPPLLREIYDPPPVIFYRGLLPNPEKPLLGMVGTRKPSPEGSRQAYSIARGVGRAGISVVSGLALGIDAVSHRGNLCAGVPGYAVLGSGADEIYPSSNRALAKRILDSGGAILCEYPPGTRPAKWNFPARNRIISALSRSVLVVEAPKKSGALITADLALGHGKDLWVASSGAMRQYGAFDKSGTAKLAYDGAEIIFSARDVLEKWNMEIADNEETAVTELGESGKGLASSMAKLLEIEL